MAKAKTAGFECSGEWIKSRLTFNGATEDDGTITIDPEQSNGKFTGTHNSSGGALFDTQCKTGEIEFKREEKASDENTYVYYYRGKLTNLPGDSGVEVKAGNGHCRRSLKITLKKSKSGKAPLADDDGDWTAQKPITLLKRTKSS